MDKRILNMVMVCAPTKSPSVEEVEAQALYTALMTDTLIEEDSEEADHEPV